MVLTAYFVISPVIGFIVTVISRIWPVRARSGRHAFARLDAGIEASGPHDFAVRSNISRRHALQSLTGWTPPCDHLARFNAAASTASRLASVTIASAPL
jgi:hypothetical protein